MRRARDSVMSRSKQTSALEVERSERAVHHVEADVAVRRVVEGLWDGADDLEPECLPELHRRLVRLDHRVELDRAKALPAGPVDHVLAERAAHALPAS